MDQSPGPQTTYLADHKWRKAMFNNLEEQIESTQGSSPSQVERLVRYLVVAVLSVLLFGGLFLGVWFLEY